MPNVNAVNTGQKVAVIGQKLLENKLEFISSINQQYSESFKAPEKFGETLTIRETLSPPVNEARTAAPPPFQEGSKTLTVDKRANTSTEWYTIETMTEIADFAKRVLEPQTSAIAANITDRVLNDVVKESPIYTTTAVSMKEVLLARAQLSLQLPNMANLRCLTNSLDEATIINANADRFNSQAELSKEYKEGYLGFAAGMRFSSTPMLQNFLTGTSTVRVGALAASIAEGAQVAQVTGFTASSTVLKGEVFTVPGIFEVNPQTKKTYVGQLKQFIVAADTTLDGSGAGDLPLTEPVSFGATASSKNVSAQPTIGLSVTLKGAANGSYAQNIIYDPNFATVAFLKPKNKLGNIPMSTWMKNGISFRYGSEGNLTEDMELHRFDTYFGYTALRGALGIRIVDFT